MSSTCNISYWLLIHTSGSCYQISAHRLEQQTNNCQSSHLLGETGTKEFPSSLVFIEADGVFPFHMRSEDLHVRETGRGPCYGSSNRAVGRYECHHVITSFSSSAQETMSYASRVFSSHYSLSLCRLFKVS